jgi:hypothetical protein
MHGREDSHNESWPKRRIWRPLAPTNDYIIAKVQDINNRVNGLTATVNHRSSRHIVSSKFFLFLMTTNNCI